MSDLKVTIGADGKELSNELKKSGKEVEVFAAKTDKALEGVGAGFKKLSTSSNSAGLAMTNFGRVLQDAPFGFIGIQNNLNPLLEGFQRLKAESGGTGNALKSLAGSLMGAGGIGLAISAITAAITFAQVGLRAWGIDLDKGKEKVDKLTDSVKSLAEMQKEGNKNAASEVGELRTLYNATQDLTVPLSTRIRLVKELKSQFPDYFSQFSQEAILAGKATDNYIKLTAAIKAKGLAQAGEKNRGLIINKIFDEEDKKVQAQIALTEANAKKAKLQDQFYKTLDNQARSVLAPRLKDINDSINQYRATIKGADSEILTLNRSLSVTDALTQKLVKQFGGGIVTGNVESFKTDQDKDKPKVAKKKTPADILKQLGLDLETIRVTGQASGETFSEGFEKAIAANKKAIGALIGIGVKSDSPIIGQLTSDIKKLTPLADDLQAKFADLSGNIQASVDQINTTNLIPFDKGLADIAARIPKYTSSMQETLARFNEDVTNIINGGLADAFAGMGTAIGEAFASGTSLAEGLGQALLGTLAEVLGQLGKLAIATGVAMLGIKAAFKNPFGAIAAGVALVALSAFVAKKASSIGNSVGGGSSSGMGSPASGSASGSGFSSSNATGQGISGTVVFEISGYKLLGVLQNVTGRNLRIS